MTNPTLALPANAAAGSRDMPAAVLDAVAAAARLVRDRAGMAAVDFAMILPMLMLLTLGTVELARALSAYQQLTDASFTAMRYAMVHGATSSEPATERQVADMARDRLPSLDPSLATVDVTWTPGNRPGSQVVVTVSYRFASVIDALPPMTLASTAVGVVTY